MHTHIDWYNQDTCVYNAGPNNLPGVYGFHRKTENYCWFRNQTEKKKLRSKNVTFYFYSSFILIYFKTLYILQTDTNTKGQICFVYILETLQNFVIILRFPPKTYTINKIHKKCF